MDLHIIGAGPAGSISAISAIKNRNASVIISEQLKKGERKKSCSGLFSLDGMNSLNEFVDYRKTQVNHINGAMIDLAGEKIIVKRNAPVAVVCDRRKFDEELISNAEMEGAKINFGEMIGERFHANNIIGADGANSSVAKHFHFPKIKKFVSTMKARVSYEAEDSHMVEVYLNSTFPGFFGWIIPHNESEAEIGCGVELPNNPKKAFDALLKMKRIKKVGEMMGAVIPISVRSKTAKRIDGKNVLLVGDAAGQVKSTTGGGVIFGGNCARISGKYFDKPFSYELEWKKEFGFDIHAHSFVHDYLARKNDGQLKKMGEKLKTSGLETYLSKHGHMDKPSRMLDLRIVYAAIGAI